MSLKEQSNNQAKSLKVLIEKTLKCDTRSPNIANVTQQDVAEDTAKHQDAVAHVYYKLFEMGARQIAEHDYTKMYYLALFTRALQTGFKEDEFRKLHWFNDLHIKLERHHLNDHCPDDVNLIDIIEMIIDGVCAFKARDTGGEFRPIVLSNDILKKAVANTAQLLLDNIEATDGESDDYGDIEGPFDKHPIIYDVAEKMIKNNPEDEFREILEEEADAKDI